MQMEKAPVVSIVEGHVADAARVSSTDIYIGSTDVYPVVRGRFNNFPVSYILQGGNGPCPLLAVCNVLLFRGALSLPADMKEIKFELLIEKLANIMIDKNQTADDTLQSTLDRSVGLLSTLNKGLDVDVKFATVDGFEYTDAMSIFDLLDIHVYHGWVVSEDDFSAYPYLCQLTYNSAVQKLTQYEDVKAQLLKPDVMIESLSAENKEIIEEGDAICKWLAANASQLTSDGIIQLNNALNDMDLAVLFRNNHFSLLLKTHGRLYALVTDIGFKGTSVMWESVDQLDGDIVYLDSSFNPSNGTAAESDYDMAMRMQYGQVTVIPASNVSLLQPRRAPKKCCTIM